QSSLSKDSINQMVKDAEAHAEEDRLRKEEAEVRNQADTLLYQTEKLVRDQGDKLDAAEKADMDNALAELREALNGEDTDRIKRATEELGAASQKVGQKLYEQAAAQAQSEEPAAGSAADGGTEADEVVDAEIVDEDEK
ncbi:MAG: Hsp70 family protein, partial [Actinomycetes bacterium]